MSRRIEIELTSQRDPEVWTWRAAGAKQPKGTVAAAVLYDGAKVGDVARAEADFEVEGITIVSVAAPSGKHGQAAPALLEIKGSGRKEELVTQQLVEKKDRPRRPGGPRRDGERSDGPRRDSRDSRGSSSDRPPRRDSAPRRDRPERPARPPRPETPTFKKLVPKDDNRRALLDTLEPTQRPFAEQALRGGIPSVRAAIEAENKKAKEEGRPELNSAALIVMTEELLPQLKAADWMDRAIAAKADVNEISVRDLKAVVSGADAVARTDEARLLAVELRDALARREVEAREAWVKDITESLEGGRVVRALRLSARPPDAQTKFPPELMDKLKAGAEEGMSPETAPDRWITMIDAVSNSPIRRSVEPKGLPATPGDELLTAAKAAAGRIPALAKMLGVTMPPPPPVRRPIPPKPASAAKEQAPKPVKAPAES